MAKNDNKRDKKHHSKELTHLVKCDRANVIRNISIIGAQCSGKTTLVDSMLAHSLDKTVQDEDDFFFRDYEPPTTVELKPYAMLHKICEENYILIEDPDNKDENPENDLILINLVDTPGHVDLSAEVTAALRITDGAIVVVDCISGCCLSTENVIRQSMVERIKPTLFLNKLDRALVEFCLEKEELYQILHKVIENMNIIIATYDIEDKGEKFVPIDPSSGSVVFGSIVDDWAFSLRDFAEIYSSIFQASIAKIMDKLWGEDFFNKATKKWTRVKKGNSERGFNMFILDPIFKIFNAIRNFKKSEAEKLLQTLKIELSPEDWKREGTDLLRVVMHSWIPAVKVLFRLITVHLPSPVTAQKYRAKYLYSRYSDDDDDIVYEGILSCNVDAPLMMYVSKMIPAKEEGKFYAFGRVFSGLVLKSENVRIMGTKYNADKKDHLHFKEIGQPVIFTGNQYKEVKEVSAGNICGIFGVDKYLKKFGTISNYKEASTIKNMKFSVLPIIRIKVEPFNPSELPNVIRGLKWLAKADPLVKHSIEDTGVHIIGVSGEFHLKQCLKKLEDEYASVTIKYSEPIVSVRETVTNKSSQVCMAKSPNQHNRIYMTAEPLSDNLVLDIENNRITPEHDSKFFKSFLTKHHKFNSKETLKLWAFGPEECGPNFLIDQTNGVKHQNDIKHLIVSAFQTATKKGVLCNEPTRGIRFNLCDVDVFVEGIKEETGRVMSTTHRALNASFLTASPLLQEPVFKCEIHCPVNYLKVTYDILGKRQGVLYEENQIIGTSLYVLRAYVPISSAFDLYDELDSQTENQVTCQCTFDQWQLMFDSPLEEFTKPFELVMSLRKLKGLPEKLPVVREYIDKVNYDN